jgi:hypothetical protein
MGEDMSVREPEGPDGKLEAELSRLFADYREALPDPEPSADFMPRLWRRIEARQSSVRDLRRLAQGFVTAAALLSVLIGVFLTRTERQGSVFYTNTYLEILAADQSQGSPDDDVELVRAEQAAYESTP